MNFVKETFQNSHNIQSQQNKFYDDYDDDDNSPTKPLSYFSPEERRLLIDKLIEKRKRNTSFENANGNLVRFSQGNNDQNANSISSIRAVRIEKSFESNYPQQYWAEDDYYSEIPSVKHTNSRIPYSLNPTLRNQTMRSRSLSAPSRRPTDSPRDNIKCPHDFTFKPQIKPLPSHYGQCRSESGPFYDRMLRWKNDKENQVRRKQVEVEHREVDDCTFQPKINRNSEMILAESRGNLSPIVDNSAFVRLYRAHEMQVEQKANKCEREYQRNLRRDEMYCTFQPKLFTVQDLYEGVKSRYSRDDSRRRNIESEENLHAPKDCKFIPVVAELKPHMKAARKYIETPLVNRLKTPMTIEVPVRVKTPIRLRSSVSAKTTAESINTSSRLRAPSASESSSTTKMRSMSFNQRLKSGVNRSLAGSDCESGGSINGWSRPRSPTALSSSMQSFLQRSKQFEIRKSKNLDELQRRAQLSFSPTRMTRHNDDVNNISTGIGFYDRMERCMLRQRENANRNEVMGHSIEARELTFQPTITRRSSRLRSRSVSEMSTGDLLHRDANRRLLRLKQDEEELAHLTFEPALTLKAHEVQSSLHLRENPSLHLDLQKRKDEIMRRRREELATQRAEKEVEGCTFSPSITPYPEYIKRIADTLSRVRKTRMATVTPARGSKPDWK